MPEFRFDLSECTANWQVLLEFAGVLLERVAGAGISNFGLSGYDTPLN